ncbi:MAG: ATP-binding protein [Nitrospirae bacterium]|nr:MAG: ATP-binding protein [Nitrospirota bacterium]
MDTSSTAQHCTPHPERTMPTQESLHESHDEAQPLMLRTIAIGAIAALVPPHASDDDSPPPEQVYLEHHLRTVSQQGDRWDERLSRYFQSPHPSDHPLLHLAQTLRLSVLEVLTVALAAAVEEDILLGRALARVQAPLGGSRPTVGLVEAAFRPFVGPTIRIPATLATGIAVQCGLLSFSNEGAPLPERAITVPFHLCMALQGHESTIASATIEPLESPSIGILPPSILEQARTHAAALRERPHRILVIRSGSLEEGRAVASAIARALNLRSAVLEAETTTSLTPWLLLHGLLPVWRLTLGPAERKTLPELPHYHGPVLAICGPEGSIEARDASVINWSVPVPTRTERVDLWTATLESPIDVARTLAIHHRHRSDRILKLGQAARYQAHLKGRTQPKMEDIIAAARAGENTGLEALAQPLTDDVSDDALVVSPPVRQELSTLLLRCASRDGLTEHLGPSATTRYRPGVRALFVGPSGTGKTLAAGWVATQLGLPLFRVDLASVVSKYIGETEKNLAQLLASAEHAEVILLFDEADSLFGRRTDVKDANDRFANTQTNYLLQRIESYEGIVILTSNSRSRFDTAFTRRLDLIVEFPLPGPEERRALWQSHLGDQHCIAPKDLNKLAATADLGGGHIRNVVLAAAVLARTHHRPIAYDDIVQGLRVEYRKLGRQMPVALTTDA